MKEHLSLSELVDPGAPPVLVTQAHHLSVERHSHDFYELVYIRDGFCLHEVDDKMTLLMEGDLFMLKPGQYHRYSGNRVVNIYNCLFAVSELPIPLLANNILSGSAGVPHIHLELSERKGVQRTLSAMLEELDGKQEGWELKLKSLFDCLLVDYVRMYGRRVGADGQNQTYMGYVMPALNYIDKHYAEEISVREVATAVGVSGDYLARQLKQVIGITPLEYIRRYRFARAMELLQRDVTVTDVAGRVGFGSLAHFSREFKKELGITPSEYKHQNQLGG